MGAIRSSLYRLGRRLLPLSWRRALRRLVPVDRLFAVRETEPARAFPPPAPREELPGRPDILVLPAIEWTFRRQRPQQLSLAVAALGGRVFYGDWAIGEPRAASPGVVLFPLRPMRLEDLHDRPPRPADIEEVAREIAALAERFSIREAVVLVESPFWRGLAAALRSRFAWKILYDCLDEHAGFSTARGSFVEAEERELAPAADLVLASSAALEEKMSGLARRVLLLRNAGDSDAFSSVPGAAPAERPRIGYFGAVADWFDTELVAELARRRPGWDFELVGSTYTARLSPLKGLPNVHRTGEVPYDRLPALLAGWNACLIPFLDTPLTRATDPVKVYEMLAAGRPVVASPLPELLRLRDAGLLRVASDAAGFERELAASLEESGTEPAERRRAFARENSWSGRAQELLAAARSLYPRVSVVVVTFNNLEWSRACLRSVLERTEWPNLEIVVVDNGSGDGTAEWLRSCPPPAGAAGKVLANPSNRGFAAAVNQGIREASGDFLCLLNNDTVVAAGWLSSLMAHLARDAGLGMVGPSTNEIANEAKVPTGYGDLAALPAWARDFTRAHAGELVPLPMLAMFCVLFRRSLYEAVGPLDERFAVGMFEDDDYCRRIRLAGFTLGCARDAFVHHLGRGGFRQLGEGRYREIYRENQRRYREKWRDDP